MSLIHGFRGRRRVSATFAFLSNTCKTVAGLSATRHGPTGGFVFSRRVSATFAFLSNTCKTVAGLSATRQGPTSGFVFSRRVSATFAFLSNTCKTVAGLSATRQGPTSGFVFSRRVSATFALVLCSGLVRGGPAASNPGGGNVPQPSTLPQLKKKYERQPAPEFPAANRFTADRETLGRTLFFDPRLSGSGVISCATCHNPGFSWADALPKGLGDGMKPLKRHTPTILNAGYGELQFWDGRAGSLEEQALGPIQSKAEMNMPQGQMLERVSAIAGYRPLFEKAYPSEGISEKTISKAIATFERTVVSLPAPFDDWIGGDEGAISLESKRGFALFNGKAGCAQCHSGWNFTDSGFHDIGVNDGDLGRGALVPIEAMQHAFKTPTLRNAAGRAPYLHDGSEANLAKVIDFYDEGGKAKRASLAPEMQPLHLTAAEKADLLAFLGTLTSNDKSVAVPALPR